MPSAPVLPSPAADVLPAPLLPYGPAELPSLASARSFQPLPTALLLPPVGKAAAQGVV